MEGARVTSNLEHFSALAFLPSISAWLDNGSDGLRDGTSDLQPLFDHVNSVCTNHHPTSVGPSVVPAPSNNWQVFFLLIIEAAGILGNLLVCVSVAIERRLKTITNYILVSLAVADLLVSLVVMPGYIAQEYKGFWPFGLITCTLWQMSDVTMCTSSIMHMCIISFDRYKCIRDPMSIRSRSKFSVVLRISAVWFFSIVISTPLAFLAAFRSSDILNSKSECIISNPNFLVYGSIAAFFLPLLVMLITYSLTINLLRKKAAEVERSGGLRRSVSNRRHRSRKSHFLLRPTMSLNCESISKSWHCDRATSSDGYSSLNGRYQADSRFALVSSSNIEVNKCTSNDIELTGLKFPSAAEFKRQEGTDRMKAAKDDLISWKKVKKKEQATETYFPADVGPQSTGTSAAPLIPASGVLLSPKIATGRCRSTSSGDLSSREKSSSRQNSLLSTDPTRLRYYHLHLHNDCSKMTGKKSSVGPNEGNTTMRELPSGAFPPRNQAIQRIMELERSSCSLDNSATLTNNSNSCSDRNSDCNRTNSDFPELTNSLPPLNRSHTTPTSVRGFHKKFRFVESVDGRFSGSQTALNGRSKNSKAAGSFGNGGNRGNISKTVTNERKAVKVLGLMFIMFVACWAVFFCVNLSMGVCPECEFDESLFKYLLWLGYTSSLINPIIYTAFNLSFRRSFYRILTCQLCRCKAAKK